MSIIPALLQPAHQSSIPHRSTHHGGKAIVFSRNEARSFQLPFQLFNDEVSTAARLCSHHEPCLSRLVAELKRSHKTCSACDFSSGWCTPSAIISMNTELDAKWEWTTVLSSHQSFPPEFCPVLVPFVASSLSLRRFGEICSGIVVLRIERQ